MEVKFDVFLTVEVHMGENLASLFSRFTRRRLVHALSTRSSRVKCCTRHSVILTAERFEMRKRESLPLTMRRENPEAVSKFF